MRSLYKLTWVELKLFFREPLGAFFTLLFPLMLLFLFGSIYGNQPTPLFGGQGTIDISVPAYTAMIIATSGLLGLSISLAGYRERGILRRLSATPLRPHAVLAAQTTVLFLMTALGMALLVAAGKLVYGLRFQGQVWGVAGGFVLSCLSFFALGFVLAGLLPTARTAQIVVMVVFYPMLFLSGAGMPRELMPKAVQRAAEFLPLTYVVNLLRGLWVGHSWAAHTRDVAVLGGLLVAGAVVSGLTFRWE